ncbi:MAG: NUDIX hydrolase [Promethearchaeota archaeon]
MSSNWEGKGTFRLRAAGAAFKGDSILLERLKGWDFWTLPGGGVHFLETTEQALRREMLEEINSQIIIERLLWIVEGFYQEETEDSEPFHEIGFYYLFNFLTDSPCYRQNTFIGDEDGKELVLKWHSTSTLNSCPLYPAFLRKGLLNLPKDITHVQIREGRMLDEK